MRNPRQDITIYTVEKKPNSSATYRHNERGSWMTGSPANRALPLTGWLPLQMRRQLTKLNAFCLPSCRM